METYFDQCFDPEVESERVIEWIRSWFAANGDGCNAVLGISGGKDSSITAALLSDALGPERVIGVMMPNSQGVSDLTYGEMIVDHLGIRSLTISIRKSYDAIVAELEEHLTEKVTEQTLINLAPRLRMATLYAVSQSNNGRVANTCNLSEDWVGYSTRYGDTAGDFSPLSKFTVQEVKAIGHTLGVPGELVNRLPDDGLSGMSDEEKLGFSYEVLDKYIRTGKIENEVTKGEIDRLHAMNAFKLQPMPTYDPVLSVMDASEK